MQHQVNHPFSAGRDALSCREERTRTVRAGGRAGSADAVALSDGEDKGERAPSRRSAR
jgi:hypothetical protein